MSDIAEPSVTCDAIHDDVIEFALGTLSGRSRSLVLDHLETCSHCNAELESLTRVMDAMLWLAPEAEPSVGFESRVIERHRLSSDRRRFAPSRGARLLAVAAVLVAVLGIGAGVLATTGGGPARPLATARPITGELMSDGHVVGHVSISFGSPSWMIMDVEAGQLSGVVWCQVTLADGHIETVGKFALAHGYGSWIAPVTAGSRVQSARLVNANGTVLARASFAT